MGSPSRERISLLRLALLMPKRDPVPHQNGCYGTWYKVNCLIHLGIAEWVLACAVVPDDITMGSSRRRTKDEGKDRKVEQSYCVNSAASSNTAPGFLPISDY